MGKSGFLSQCIAHNLCPWRMLLFLNIRDNDNSRQSLHSLIALKFEFL